MFRPLPYALLFVVVLLLQTFIFDRLLISTALLPMVYIAFIILLPIHTPPAVMLMWGALVGVVFDFTMAMPGINSIATIFLCYVRWSVLNWSIERDIMLLSGAPASEKIGEWRFFRYIFVAVLIHSTILFSVEYMNLMEWDFLLRRIIYSTLFTTIFVWIIAKRFAQLVRRK